MGLWFGLVIVLELMSRKWRDSLPKLRFLSALSATLLTFALVLVGWLFFRSPSLEVAFSYLAGIFSGWGAPLSSFGFPSAELWATSILIALVVAAELLAEHAPARAKRLLASPFWRLFFYSSLVVATLALGEFHEKVFIYFQF
jgi:D-alanyl-lipoteichoic acid acyltransferase DltB (MBOAT superfamily)